MARVTSSTLPLRRRCASLLLQLLSVVCAALSIGLLSPFQFAHAQQQQQQHQREQWESVGSLPYPIFHASHLFLNRSLFLIGGCPTHDCSPPPHRSSSLGGVAVQGDERMGNVSTTANGDRSRRTLTDARYYSSVEYGIDTGEAAVSQSLLPLQEERGIAGPHAAVAITGAVYLVMSCSSSFSTEEAQTLFGGVEDDSDTASKQVDASSPSLMRRLFTSVTRGGGGRGDSTMTRTLQERQRRVVLAAAYSPIIALYPDVPSINETFFRVPSARARVNASCVALGNEILIVGGIFAETGQATESIDAFDVISHRYVADVARLDTAVLSPAVVATSDGVLIVAGGWKQVRNRDVWLNDQQQQPQQQSLRSGQEETLTVSSSRQQQLPFTFPASERISVVYYDKSTGGTDTCVTTLDDLPDTVRRGILSDPNGCHVFSFAGSIIVGNNNMTVAATVNLEAASRDDDDARPPWMVMTVAGDAGRPLRLVTDSSEPQRVSVTLPAVALSVEMVEVPEDASPAPVTRRLARAEESDEGDDASSSSSSSSRSTTTTPTTTSTDAPPPPPPPPHSNVSVLRFFRVGGKAVMRRQGTGSSSGSDGDIHYYTVPSLAVESLLLDNRTSDDSSDVTTASPAMVATSHRGLLGTFLFLPVPAIPHDDVIEAPTGVIALSMPDTVDFTTHCTMPPAPRSALTAGASACYLRLSSRRDCLGNAAGTLDTPYDGEPGAVIGFSATGSSSPVFLCMGVRVRMPRRWDPFQPPPCDDQVWFHPLNPRRHLAIRAGNVPPPPPPPPPTTTTTEAPDDSDAPSEYGSAIIYVTCGIVALLLICAVLVFAKLSEGKHDGYGGEYLLAGRGRPRRGRMTGAATGDRFAPNGNSRINNNGSSATGGGVADDDSSTQAADRRPREVTVLERMLLSRLEIAGEMIRRQGRYRVLSRIGEGDHSLVFLAMTIKPITAPAGQQQQQQVSHPGFNPSALPPLPPGPSSTRQILEEEEREGEASAETSPLLRHRPPPITPPPLPNHHHHQSTATARGQPQTLVLKFIEFPTESIRAEVTRQQERLRDLADYHPFLRHPVDVFVNYDYQQQLLHESLVGMYLTHHHHQQQQEQQQQRNAARMSGSGVLSSVSQAGVTPPLLHNPWMLPMMPAMDPPPPSVFYGHHHSNNSDSSNHQQRQPPLLLPGHHQRHQFYSYYSPYSNNYGRIDGSVGLGWAGDGDFFEGGYYHHHYNKHHNSHHHYGTGNSNPYQQQQQQQYSHYRPYRFGDGGGGDGERDSGLTPLSRQDTVTFIRDSDAGGSEDSEDAHSTSSGTSTSTSTSSSGEPMDPSVRTSGGARSSCSSDGPGDGDDNNGDDDGDACQVDFLSTGEGGGGGGKVPSSVLPPPTPRPTTSVQQQLPPSSNANVNEDESQPLQQEETLSPSQVTRCGGDISGAFNRGRGGGGRGGGGRRGGGGPVGVRWRLLVAKRNLAAPAGRFLCVAMAYERHGDLAAFVQRQQHVARLQRELEAVRKRRARPLRATTVVDGDDNNEEGCGSGAGLRTSPVGHKLFPESVIVSIAYQVASALAHLHEKQSPPLLHGAVHGSNLLIRDPIALAHQHQHVANPSDGNGRTTGGAVVGTAASVVSSSSTQSSSSTAVAAFYCASQDFTQMLRQGAEEMRYLPVTLADGGVVNWWTLVELPWRLALLDSLPDPPHRHHRHRQRHHNHSDTLRSPMSQGSHSASAGFDGGDQRRHGGGHPSFPAVVGLDDDDANDVDGGEADFNAQQQRRHRRDGHDHGGGTDATRTSVSGGGASSTSAFTIGRSRAFSHSRDGRRWLQSQSQQQHHGDDDRDSDDSLGRFLALFIELPPHTPPEQVVSSLVAASVLPAVFARTLMDSGALQGAQVQLPLQRRFLDYGEYLAQRQRQRQKKLAGGNNSHGKGRPDATINSSSKGNKRKTSAPASTRRGDTTNSASSATSVTTGLSSRHQLAVQASLVQFVTHHATAADMWGLGCVLLGCAIGLGDGFHESGNIANPFVHSHHSRSANTKNSSSSNAGRPCGWVGSESASGATFNSNSMATTVAGGSLAGPCGQQHNHSHDSGNISSSQKAHNQRHHCSHPRDVRDEWWLRARRWQKRDAAEQRYRRNVAARAVAALVSDLRGANFSSRCGKDEDGNGGCGGGGGGGGGGSCGSNNMDEEEGCPAAVRRGASHRRDTAGRDEAGGGGQLGSGPSGAPSLPSSPSPSDAEADASAITAAAAASTVPAPTVPAAAASTASPWSRHRSSSSATGTGTGTAATEPQRDRWPACFAFEDSIRAAVSAASLRATTATTPTPATAHAAALATGEVQLWAADTAANMNVSSTASPGNRSTAGGVRSVIAEEQERADGGGQRAVYSEALGNLIARLLSPLPSRRPTAGELASHFRLLMAGPGAGPGRDASQPSRRRQYRELRTAAEGDSSGGACQALAAFVEALPVAPPQGGFDERFAEILLISSGGTAGVAVAGPHSTTSS